MKSLIYAVLVVITTLVGYFGGYGRGWQQGYLEGWEDQRNSNYRQVVARELDILFVLDRVMFYESSYNPKAQGDYNAETGKYEAYGLYQFHYSTFKYYARMSGHPNYVWKNAEHQKALAYWMIRHGYGREWGYAYNHALRDLFIRHLT